MKQKLLIKVIDGDNWTWVHLCHIDDKLYKKFREIPGNEELTIGYHVSRWMLQDFSVNTSMSSKKDVWVMKNILNTWYHREYPELYLKKCPGDKQRISNLTGIWLTQHMQYEIEKYKGGKHGN